MTLPWHLSIFKIKLVTTCLQNRTDLQNLVSRESKSFELVAAGVCIVETWDTNREQNSHLVWLFGLGCKKFLAESSVRAKRKARMDQPNKNMSPTWWPLNNIVQYTLSPGSHVHKNGKDHTEASPNEYILVPEPRYRNRLIIIYYFKPSNNYVTNGTPLISLSGMEARGD